MFSLLRLVTRLGLALPWSFWCLFRFELHNFFSKQARKVLRDRYLQTWAHGILGLFSFHLSVHLPEEPLLGPFLLVANHRSAMDIPVLLSIRGGVLLSHHGVIRWPLFGFCAKRIGTVFVNRSDPHSGAQAIRRMKQTLSKGNTLIVFPEGTTFAGDEVRPFHAGAISVARFSSTTVLPVGLCYDDGIAFTDRSFRAHMFRIAKKRDLRVTAQVGKPIKVSEQKADLQVVLRDAVQALVLQARKTHRKTD